MASSERSSPPIALQIHVGGGAEDDSEEQDISPPVELTQLVVHDAAAAEEEEAVPVVQGASVIANMTPARPVAPVPTTTAALGFGVGAYLRQIPTAESNGEPRGSGMFRGPSLLDAGDSNASGGLLDPGVSPIPKRQSSVGSNSDSSTVTDKLALRTELLDIAMLHGRENSMRDVRLMVENGGVDEAGMEMAGRKRGSPVPKKTAYTHGKSPVHACGGRNAPAGAAGRRRNSKTPPHTEQDFAVRLSVYLTWLLSGAMNGMLLMVFSVVFGYIAFEADVLVKHRVLGVEAHVIALVFALFLTARFSPLRSSIGGVDVNSALSFSVCGKIVAAHVEENSVDDRAVLPSFLLVIALGTLIAGTTLWVLAYFRATALIHFWPASVLSGFLAGVGFNVMKEAVFVSTGVHPSFSTIPEIFEWENMRHILLAIPIGTGLYFLKRLHFNPLYVVPAFTLIPLILFYIALAVSGESFADMAEEDWIFPDVPDEVEYSFYSYFNEFYGSFHWIDLVAVGKCVPELLVMVVIVTIDFSLKLSGTETEMLCNRDFHKEFRLTGLINLMSSMFGAVPSYDQMKFTIINVKMTEDYMNPVPGYICGVIVAVLYFLSYPLADFLPRFYLGGLVLYAGLGFMVKNLWDVRTTLSRTDLLAVYVILFLNVFFGLLTAVIAGTVLATIIFAIQYSRSSHYNVYTLRTQHSKLVRPFAHREKLEHLSELVLIFVLRGFVFFGSAAKIQTQLSSVMEQNRLKPAYRRLRYLVLDLESVNKIDANATGVFSKITRMATENGFKILWSGLRGEIHMKLAAHGILDLAKVERASGSIPTAPSSAGGVGRRSSVSSDEDKQAPHQHQQLGVDGAAPKYNASEEDSKRFVYTRPSRRRMAVGQHSFAFETLDLALEHAEEQLLAYCNVIRAKWLILPSMKKLNAISSYTALKAPFVELESEHKIWDYCTIERVDAGEVLCRSGEMVSSVFLLQSGRVSVYLEHSDGTRSRISSFTRGACTAAAWELPCAETVVVDKVSSFLVFTRQQMEEMEVQNPTLALRVHRIIFEDVLKSRNRLEHDMDIKSHWDGYEQMMEMRERNLGRNPDLLAKILHYYDNDEQEEEEERNQNSSYSERRNSAFERRGSNQVLLSAGLSSMNRSSLERSRSLDRELSDAAAVPAVTTVTMAPTTAADAVGRPPSGLYSLKRVPSHGFLSKELSGRRGRASSAGHGGEARAEDLEQLHDSFLGPSPAKTTYELRLLQQPIDPHEHPSLAALAGPQVGRDHLVIHSGTSSLTASKKGSRRSSVFDFVVDANLLGDAAKQQLIQHQPVHGSGSRSQPTTPRRGDSVQHVFTFSGSAEAELAALKHSAAGNDTNVLVTMSPPTSAHGSASRGVTFSTPPSSSKGDRKQSMNSRRSRAQTPKHLRISSATQNTILSRPKRKTTISKVLHGDPMRRVYSDNPHPSRGPSRSRSMQFVPLKVVDQDVSLDAEIAFRDSKAAQLNDNNNNNHNGDTKQTALYDSTLSRSQIAEYSEYFYEHAVNDHKELAVKHLRHIVMDCGYYETKTEMEAILKQGGIVADKEGTITLEQFLEIMRMVSMLQLNSIDEFEQLFQRYDVKHKGVLDFEALDALFSEAFDHVLTPEEAHALIMEWGVHEKGGLQRDDFISMLAYSMKREQLDQMINLCFYFFSGSTEHIIRPQGLQQALTRAIKLTDVTLMECEEMIWVEDHSDQSQVSFKDFIKMITTVFEPGWLVLFDWHRRKTVRFLHDLCDDEDEQQMESIEDTNLELAEEELLRQFAQGMMEEEDEDDEEEVNGRRRRGGADASDKRTSVIPEGDESSRPQSPAVLPRDSILPRPFDDVVV